MKSALAKHAYKTLHQKCIFDCHWYKYSHKIQVNGQQILCRRDFHNCRTNIQLNDEFDQRNARRRVVVTGVGVVSPIGCTTQSAWTSILNSKSGIKAINDAAFDNLPCKIAAKIDENELKMQDHLSASETRSIAPATAYALIAGNFD